MMTQDDEDEGDDARQHTVMIPKILQLILEDLFS